MRTVSDLEVGWQRVADEAEALCARARDALATARTLEADVSWLTLAHRVSEQPMLPIQWRGKLKLAK